MLCVEDALDGLRWAESIGGLPALIARAEASLARRRRLGGANRLGDFLAEDPATRSNTSVCLKIADSLVRRACDAAGQADAREEARGAAGEGRRGLRHRRLSRRPAGPAHLVRRDGGDRPTSPRCCPGSTGPTPRRGAIGQAAETRAASRSTEGDGRHGEPSPGVFSWRRLGLGPRQAPHAQGAHFRQALSRRGGIFRSRGIEAD